MKVTPELIDKLAELAKLEFEEDSKAAIVKDLQEIISFVEKLGELDTTAMEPLIYITEEGSNLRKDEVSTEITRDEALLNIAPLHDDKFIKVPKVIKKS